MNYYDSIADSYNELHGEEQRRKLKLISDKLNLADERVLDVGCGTGISFEFFNNIVGLDPSEKLLEQANGEVFLGHGENLPFENNEFDVVICVSALHNFDDPQKGLDEILRVGKDIFVITILKKSPKYEDLVLILKKKFEIIEKINDSHDTVFFLKRFIS